MFVGKNKKFLKLTSGATLLAVTPTLTLQAQGGVDGPDSAASIFEESVKKSLGKKVDLNSESLKVLKYLVYTGILAGSVFLLYCLACFVDNKMALKILNNKFELKLSTIEESVQDTIIKLDEVKKVLESLEPITDRMNGKNKAVERMKEADRNMEKAKNKKEKLDEYVSLMQESGIHEGFEKNYFKLSDKIEDVGFIGKLEEICKNLDSELEKAGKKAGEKCSLRFDDVECELSKLGGDDNWILLPQNEEVVKEIEKRFSKEKERSSDVYKAYLRYEVASSLLNILKAKKADSDAKAEVEECLNAIKKGISDQRKKIEDLNLKNLCRKNILADVWDGGQEGYRSFLADFRLIEELKLDYDSSYICDILEKVKTARVSLANIIDNFQKKVIEREKKLLQSKLADYKKNKSFFHIPGKNVIESWNYEF